MKLNWGAKIGLIGGLLGGGIGMAAAIIASPVMGSIMAVIFIAVFGGTFMFFFRPLMVQNKLQKTGTSATARVLEVSDTGVTINNNPQVKLLLEVTPPMGMPYKVECKVLVSRINPFVYQPGMTVPVKIDLNNKDMVAIDMSGGTTGSYSGSAQSSPETVKKAESMLMEIEKQNQEIMAMGQSAKAIVLKYTWMGINVNGNNPAVTLDLEVIPDIEKPFKAIAKGVVAEQSVTKFQPGEEIFVKYDPNNLSRVTIEHS